MPWYVQFAIQTGLGYLTVYVQRSKLTADRKAAFAALMVSVNEFVMELENPPTA